MREQFQSQCFKHGETRDHIQARQTLILYLKAKGRRVLADNTFMFPLEFIEEHKIKRLFKGHSYDVMTSTEIFEIDDFFNSKHSKTLQKINDGIAQSYAERYLSQWKFYRVQKHEILKLDTCFDYLESVLE